ncbi:RES domain-containing protein [Sphingopyxis sp. PAMC25046]|nr:RES domain-containing protein [Sphingopyxis sp. PAMC25046]
MLKRLDCNERIEGGVMGRAKAWQMEQEERGYYEADGAICEDCVTDPALKSWVSDNVSETQCRFCGAESDDPMAASFDEFIGVVLTGVRFDWNHPDDEGIMYVSAEGGYQASISDTWDVLGDYDISDDSDVVEAIIDVVGSDGWVEREFYIGDKSQRLEWGWDAFKETVKHQTRYVFLTPDDSDHSPEVPPSRMLAAIGETVVDELAELNLITEIPADTDLFRIRIGAEPFHTGAEIGTPPAQFAMQSNRMSPAGIPMFYGAFDVDTARLETFDPDHHAGQILSIGTFRATRALRVLDLADLPDIPSVFEEDSHHCIHPLRFLHAFARDIVKPIARDGREHIEYVPTQIVTEYFRRVFRDADDCVIDGIIYSSSREGGERAFVLFCENEQCFAVEDGPVFLEQLLNLTAVAHEQT